MLSGQQFYIEEMFDVLNRFLTFSTNISQAYKYITKIKSHYMKSLGLKAAHVMCLLYIGLHEEGLTPVELSALCAEDKAAVSKNLAALKSMDLVAAADDSGDKVYRVKYKLTEKGAAIYEELGNYIVDSVDACAAGMSMEEGSVFFRTFDAVVSRMKDYYHSLEDEKERD